MSSRHQGDIGLSSNRRETNGGARRASPALLRPASRKPSRGGQEMALSSSSMAITGRRAEAMPEARVRSGARRPSARARIGGQYGIIKLNARRRRETRKRWLPKRAGERPAITIWPKSLLRAWASSASRYTANMRHSARNICRILVAISL